MFRLEKDNAEIGKYLRSKILGKYMSIRAFCRDYLKYQDGSANDEETRKLLNRFSQILKGTKRIQIDDLPYVTELLGLSCEEVLSAGKYFAPVTDRITNYSIAFEKDPIKLQEYADREDKLILNYDEYGKSVLDYAYQFKNYPFFKFLMDNGYLVFKDSSEAAFRYSYGVETTIKRRDASHTDILEAKLKDRDDLRMNIITLAIEFKDFSVLESMRARETPMMHFTAIYSTSPESPEYYDCSRLVDAIAAAPDEVLDYYSKEYTITVKGSSLNVFFVFQHLDKVIEALIRNHDKRAAGLIKAAASHNHRVYRRIKAIIDKAVQNVIERYECSKPEAENMVIVFSRFHENCDSLRFFCDNVKSGIASNIIRCDVDSSDSSIFLTLQDLNSSYDLVKTIMNRRG